MNTAWETIATCLRDELQEYGGLLGLFEEQQGALYRRDASAVLAIVTTIEEQARQATKQRLQRERVVREFAAAHGFPAISPSASSHSALGTGMPLDFKYCFKILLVVRG